MIMKKRIKKECVEQINRIKILFVHRQLTFGGAETALYDLVKLLDKTKFDISIFAIFEGGKREDDFRSLGVRVINPYSRLTPGKHIIEKAYNVLTSNIILQLLKKDSKHLFDVSIKERFDIIVSYHNEGYCNYASMPKYGKKVKYVHCDVSTNEYYKQRTDYIKRIKYPYDKIICVSEYAKNAFINEYGITENIISIFNPIDSEKITEKSLESYDNPCKGSYYCAVGRLGKEKGFERLIRIQSELVALGLKINLVIVGDGNERENLESLIESLRLQDSVYLVGFQNNPYPFIKNSMFTVVSSYSEGLSLVAMESICLSVPVVGSFPTIEEIFGGYKCGIVSKNDDDSLLNGIRTMIIDEDYYRHCVQEAHKRSFFFNGQNMVKKIEIEFLKLMQ